MLTRIRDQIAACEEEAALARIRAITAATPQLRCEYTRLEAHWRQLAESLQFAVTVSGHLQWRSRRLGVQQP
jgi:hypothetical protein